MMLRTAELLQLPYLRTALVLILAPCYSGQPKPRMSQAPEEQGCQHKGSAAQGNTCANTQ